MSMRGERAGGRWGTWNDELSQLAKLYNRTAGELNTLYAKVRHSEAYFRSLIEHASDLIVILNRAGILVYASPSSVRVLGHSDDDLLGRPLRDLAHLDDAAGLEQVIANAHQGAAATQPFTLRFRH